MENQSAVANPLHENNLPTLHSLVGLLALYCGYGSKNDTEFHCISKQLPIYIPSDHQFVIWSHVCGHLALH